MPDNNQPDGLIFSWKSSAAIADVCEIEAKSLVSWNHARSIFEESIQYQRLLLAKTGTTPVAYLIYEVIWGNTPFLSLLKVVPGYQRRGIATQMINLLEERLTDLGFKSYVTSSETTNQNTKKFFPSLGFARIGELQMQHGEEIFYMKSLRLNS